MTENNCNTVKIPCKSAWHLSFQPGNSRTLWLQNKRACKPHVHCQKNLSVTRAAFVEARQPFWFKALITSCREDFGFLLCATKFCVLVSRVTKLETAVAAVGESQCVSRRSSASAEVFGEGTTDTASVRRARFERGRGAFGAADGMRSPQHQSISPTSWPSCGFVSKICNGRTKICDLNCSLEEEVPKNDSENPGICQIPPSIWCPNRAQVDRTVHVVGLSLPLMNGVLLRVISSDGDNDRQVQSVGMMGNSCVQGRYGFARPCGRGQQSRPFIDVHFSR